MPTTIRTTDAAPSSAPGTSTLPDLAGASEVSAAAVLHDGLADGVVTIDYLGLGQVDSPLTGTCTSSGATTEVVGTAGSASVDLSFSGDVVALVVTDEGLGTSSARVGRGDLTVSEGALRLRAPLIQAEQVTGTVALDITCTA